MTLSNKVLVFSPLPGRVKKVVQIPRPANDGAGGLRRTTQAAEIEAELRALLREDGVRV